MLPARKRPEVPEEPKVPTTVSKKPCVFLTPCGMCELKKVWCEKYGLPANKTHNYPH